MSIIGIDPSLTSCGIAVLGCDNSAKPSTRIVTLRSVGHPGTDADDWATRSDRIVSQAHHVLRTLPGDLELAIIEGPAYGQHMPSTHDRAGLWWGLFSGLRAQRIPVAVCAPSSRAKWITGKGTAKKTEVLAAIRKHWPDNQIRNHDEADAVGMACIAAHKLGWTLPFEIKDRHTVGLDAVAWPKEIA